VILAAARALFLEHGFASTSVDAVTRRSGVSKATVYAYFPHKEAILEAVVREESSKLLAPLDFVATGDARADLMRAAESMAGVAASPEVMAWDRMISAEARRNPELGRLFYDAGPGRVHRRLADLFRKLEALGVLSVTDADEAASFCFGVLVGEPILRNQLCGDDAPYRPDKDRIARVVDLFLRAYAPTSPARRPRGGKR
jgi:AcrR family transcriptional regulator